MITITKKEAAGFLMRYQNLYNPRQLKTDTQILKFIKKIGCIQYDPLNTCARNADLVLQSRCRNYSTDVLYNLLYMQRKLIDGWDKNMSIWSVSDWPYFERDRKKNNKRLIKRAAEFNKAKKQIAEVIAKNGFLNSKDVFQNSTATWSWAPTDAGRAALESMYHSGELLIHHKEGTRKYYGLAKDLLESDIINASDPNTTLEAFQDWYVKRRINSVGMLWLKSGDAWLGTKLKKPERLAAAERLLEKNEIEAVKVEGIDELFYIDTQYVKLFHEKKEYSEAAIIAPLDNLIWDRKLIIDIFDFHYKWEVYTPQSKRMYGYYVLPVLYKEKFIARFEPFRIQKSKELVIKNWWWEKNVVVSSDMKEALNRCFLDFYRFLGVEKIVISHDVKKNSLGWMMQDFDRDC